MYLWGENSGSRLTSLRWFDHDFGDVAWPADITNCFTVPSGGSEKVPVGLVDLQAGGWSFAARDMRGGVWVWGELCVGDLKLMCRPSRWTRMDEARLGKCLCYC